MYFQNTVVDNGVKKQSNYKKQKIGTIRDGLMLIQLNK